MLASNGGMNDLMPAAEGAGPLLQRDYWAVFDPCDHSPAEVMTYVKAHFCELPPDALVHFTATQGIGLGARLDIVIRPAQDCAVVVIHDTPQSVTLGTIEGHPEAGRITFGAYRNDAGQVVFHIRSRARASSGTALVGFFAIGEAMQTDTWTDFINNTVAGLGARIDGPIRAETTEVDDRPEDAGGRPSPTFLAVGD